MSTPSSSPSPDASNSGNNSNDPVNFTALIVALVALVVSMLQLILQYLLSAEGRNKVGEAAIGKWSDKNRHYWRPWKGKLYIKYARPTVSISVLLETMKARGKEKQSNLEALAAYKVTEKAKIHETKDGIQVVGAPEIALTRRGTEETTPILAGTLRGRERVAANALLKASQKLFAASPPTKATWCALLCDLGMDLKKVPTTGELINAETIPAVLDAPPLQIRMSDLIKFGLLLEMRLVEVDELKRVLSMTGFHCSLITRHQDGIGMLCRYTPMAPDTQPAIRRTSDSEAQMLCDTADGMIFLGDCMMPLSSWGYNSLDNVFRYVLKALSGNNTWQEFPLKDYLRNAEGDGGLVWEGKWANPATPVVALLMAMSGNVGVCAAFPHECISGWEHSMIKSATRAAFQALEQKPGFVVSPRDIFQRIRDSGSDHMVMLLNDEFKTVNNYGCQFGGVRGWLSTNLAEFTLRMSRVWPREHHPGHGEWEPVPILVQLYPVLQAGALCKEWGDRYNFKQEEGPGWKLPAASMLWLQIALLDTWLGHHIDILIGATAMPELTVPAEIAAAELCANTASQYLTQSTSWNPPRLHFCRLYLNRLASGVGRAGTSFMSTLERFPDARMGWKEMNVGNSTPDQWVMVDAVMTLRAVCQHTRLMLMRDSSSLLRLRKFDPVLLLA